MKNQAIDTTYETKFNNKWHGRQLKSMKRDLHHLFDPDIDKVWDGRDKGDLGRVVLYHAGLIRLSFLRPLQVY